MEKKTSKTAKFNLYKKEQFVLCIILLCFALSGIALPKLNDYLHPVSPPSDNIIEDTTIDSGVTRPPSTEVKDVLAESDISNPLQTSDDNTSEPDFSVDVDTSHNSEPSNDSSSSPPSSKPSKEPAKEPTDGKPTESNTETPKNPTSENPKESNTETPEQSTTETPKEPSTEPPKEPEKVWVPPVYETLHHEAIYETIRVVICNYCSEEFSTVGEFQVHKNAHGG